MKNAFKIVLTLILLTVWGAGCHAWLSQVRYEPGSACEMEKAGEGSVTGYCTSSGAMSFRQAVLEASLNIEPGLQPRPSTISQYGNNRVGAGSSKRIPVAIAQFLKTPQSKVPKLIQTYKNISAASFRSRDFYVIGLRHLII